MMTFLLATFVSISFSQTFPAKPDPIFTPGEICYKPKKTAYPEKVQLCERDVAKETKLKVIEYYISKYSFNYDNKNYKLDHYIPLCMGGSNSASNLWVQHKSIYSITDKFEFSLCLKMSEGKLKQRDAIFLIKRLKNNIEQADKIKQEQRLYLK